MRQIDGEEDNALTWGGLHDTPSNVGNRSREASLNMQKSADAIVRPW
jgi:hypothetical protein